MNNDNAQTNVNSLPAVNYGPLQFKEGQVFGKYTLIRHLGTGGMGEVWEAEHPTLGRRAIKFLLPTYSADKKFARKFKDEIVAISKVGDNSHIAQVFDCETENDVKYYITALVLGKDGNPQTLRIILTKKEGNETKSVKLPEEAVRDLALQTADGLQHIHKNDILHLDIKPENILINKSGTVQISDFGLSKTPEDLNKGTSYTSLRGSGTLYYMPLEQFKGEEVDSRADIYAFGKMLHEMLTGIVPVPFLPVDCSGLSAQWAALITAMTDDAPKKRLQSMDEVIRRLKAIQQPVKTPSNGIVKFFFAAMVLFAFIAGTVLYVNNKNTQQSEPEQPKSSVETKTFDTPQNEAVTAEKKLDEPNPQIEADKTGLQTVTLPPTETLNVSDADKQIEALRSAAAQSKKDYEELQSKQAAEAKRRKEAEDTLRKILDISQNDAATAKRKLDELNAQIEADKKAVAEAETKAEAARIEAEKQKKMLEELQAKADKAEAERKARNTPASGSAKQPGELFEFPLKGVKWRFRFCPSGTFQMGSPESEADRSNKETRHQVTLTRGFWLGETAVTQEQWEAVMGDNPSIFHGAKLPVQRVSWDDCQKFISGLNRLGVAPSGFKFSLPTEAQWEYACRAGTTAAYCFGDAENQLGDYAWYGANSGRTTTHTVGTKKANAWGLYDMHGNVFEWCSDWHGDYPTGNVTDPLGASFVFCWDQVRRGGSWGCYARNCRSADRSDDASYDWNLGLRISLVSDGK
ncbi:hypothetical protein FACS1894170_00400 [Planctomycetales bacterium]|nr:hypothetical protein FACS1894170_00400 [Planctomycetales bacterium]